MKHPHPFPIVTAVKKELLESRGINTNVWYPSDEDREIASRFDVAKHLAEAIKLRTANINNED